MDIKLMAYLGGIPTIFSLILLFVSVFFLTKNKAVSPKAIRTMKKSSKEANKAYYEIKKLLPSAKPLVRLHFRLLVGEKRWKDYNYQP